MRFLLVALVVLLSPTIASVQTSNPRSSSDSTPKIELKLVAEKATIRPGERLKLRVELWNLGTEDIIIAQNIDRTFGNSELELFLEVGSAFQGSQMHGVADRIPDSNPDFAKTFVTNWLTLNKGHFYGTYVYLDPVDFPPLQDLGDYHVLAEYSSRGISSVPSWNGGFLKEEDIAKLPFSAWKGTVSSNLASVHVRARAKKTIGK